MAAAWPDRPRALPQGPADVAPRHAAGGRRAVSACPNCEGSGLVCEWHPDKPWTPTASAAGADSCECGAGMPCPVCRPVSRRVTEEETFAEAVRNAIDTTARE